MNNQSHERPDRRPVKWQRLAIDTLGVIGVILMCGKGSDFEEWLRHQLYPTPVAATVPGMTQEDQAKIRDQLGDALRNGGSESFLSGVAHCTIAGQTVEIENPVDMILDNGHEVIAAVIPGSNGQGLDVLVVDPAHPGAPLTTGAPPCTFTPDMARPGLQFHSVYNFHFVHGSPSQPIDESTGKPFTDDAGRPLPIGRLITTDGN